MEYALEQLSGIITGYTDWAQICEWLVRIILSFICGVCIGWERRNRRQLIGIRTLLLICMSSTLLGILSEYAAFSSDNISGDPTRISAAVITGIGFVGGGAIMHRGFNVKGVTTAALIWSTAAIGLSLGDGLYIPALFIFVLILVALPAFQKFESRHFQTGKMKILRLVYSDSQIDFEKAKSCILQSGNMINDMSFSTDESQGTNEIDFYIYASNQINPFVLSEQLKKTGNLVKFSLSDS